MKPLLENPENKPDSEAMQAAYGMSLDLLKIRNSTPLLTLGTADLIKEKVTFPNAGPEATPGFLVMAIDDKQDDTSSVDVDADTDGVLVIFNASPEPITEAIDDQAGRAYELIGIQKDGYDEVVKGTKWDASTGTVTIPARTVAVLVEEAGAVPPVEPTDPPVEPTDPPVEPTTPPVEPTKPPTAGGGSGSGLATTGASTAGLIALAVLLGAAGLGLLARRRGQLGN